MPIDKLQIGCYPYHMLDNLCLGSQMILAVEPRLVKVEGIALNAWNSEVRTWARSGKQTNTTTTDREVTTNE